MNSPELKPHPIENQQANNPLTSFITCSACSGHGTYWKPSVTYTQPVLAKCQPCEGTGQVLICNNCGAKLAYGRLGRSCGCNSVALNLSQLQKAA
jgi:RecJ-like exonuclease